MATLAPTQQGTRSDVVGIMLVDAHAIVRQGLRSILERENDLRVVAEASSASEALAVQVASQRDDAPPPDGALATVADVVAHPMSASERMSSR